MKSREIGRVITMQYQGNYPAYYGKVTNDGNGFSIRLEGGWDSWSFAVFSESDDWLTG